MNQELALAEIAMNLNARDERFVCLLLNVPATCECISGTEKREDRREVE